MECSAIGVLERHKNVDETGSLMQVKEVVLLPEKSCATLVSVLWVSTKFSEPDWCTDSETYAT
jgi:hypothetical protein